MTSLLVGLYITSRLVMVGAREWLLPPMLANVSTRTQTPVAAQLLTGAIAAIVCLFVSLELLVGLAGFAYVLVLLIVANVYLARRYWPSVKMVYGVYGDVEAIAPRFLSRENQANGSSAPSAPRESPTISKPHKPSKSLKEEDACGESPESRKSQTSTKTAAINSNPKLWRILGIEHQISTSKKIRRVVFMAFLLGINGAAIGVGVASRESDTKWLSFVPLFIWFICTSLMYVYLQYLSCRARPP